MTRFEFYSKLNKFKDKNSLEHSFSKAVTNVANRAKTMANYGYYNKIDNYYGPGKTRYFYSKEEWDAYQNHKDALLQKAKDDVKKANDEKIKKENEKYANVNAAQNARKQEEKKATYAERERQIKEMDKRTDDSKKMLNDFLNKIQESGGNTDSYIIDTLQKELGNNYKVYKDKDGNFKIDMSWDNTPDLLKRKKRNRYKRS